MLTLAAAANCPDRQKQLCCTCKAGVGRLNVMLGAVSTLGSYSCAMQRLQDNFSVNISLCHVSEHDNSQCWIQGKHRYVKDHVAHWATTAGGHERENAE
jgi:hypothetical protein